jgi:hypothetical protein
LFKEGFHDMVARIQENVERGSTPMEKWQNKIQYLRKYLWGWAKNMNGMCRKQKKELISNLEPLDKKVETTMLLPHEVDIKRCLKSRLSQLLLELEIMWF